MIIGNNQTTSIELPPANALRVYRWADLPNLTAPAFYRVTDPGQEPREIYASKHKRQVLEGLMRSPLYVASYCRLSDQVLPLRRDDGVNIECKMYRGDKDTGRQKYGIYFLVSKVELIQANEMAA